MQRLEQEAGQPRADVFFSSELFNTILLARKGVLEKYDPATAEDIPDRYRDSERRWTAIGLRARVLAYDLELTPPSMLPTSWEELAKPQYATNLAFANPLFGTTRGHVAAMFAGWGSQRAKAFLTGLRDNGAFITDSNSAALRAVLAFRSQTCATDTDDVYLARTRQGADDLDLRHLDMGDGGTLLIPFSVALIKGGPNPKAGKRLVDFLVSEEVERMLAQSDSHNIPVRALLREELNMILPPESNISYDKIADHMDEAVQAVREILIR